MANLVPVLIIMFGLHSANTFYNICYPTFPEFDQQHRPVPRFGPHVKDNSTLTVQLTARRDGSRRETKLAEHQVPHFDPYTPHKTGHHRNRSHPPQCVPGSFVGCFVGPSDSRCNVLGSRLALQPCVFPAQCVYLCSALIHSHLLASHSNPLGCS